MTFHPPIKVSASSHPGLIRKDAVGEEAVRMLTTSMGEEIRRGTLDAPSWKYIRIAHTARRLYAPLGTKIGLGDYVRFVSSSFPSLTSKKTDEEMERID